MGRKKKPECYRCGDVATIQAFDFPGPGVWYCNLCRSQVRSGADMWPWTGIAAGNGPRNGRQCKHGPRTESGKCPRKGSKLAGLGAAKRGVQPGSKAYEAWKKAEQEKVEAWRSKPNMPMYETFPDEAEPLRPRPPLEQGWSDDPRMAQSQRWDPAKVRWRPVAEEDYEAEAMTTDTPKPGERVSVWLDNVRQPARVATDSVQAPTWHDETTGELMVLVDLADGRRLDVPANRLERQPERPVITPGASDMKFRPI